MQLRHGTSFVEVLVASVLLAVGIVGCLSTLAAAARLRNGATLREDLAARAHDQLGWFFAQGCLAADTSYTAPASARIEEHWEHHRDASGARFAIALQVRASTRNEKLAIAADLPCP
jgi:hypothetical protein